LDHSLVDQLPERPKRAVRRLEMVAIPFGAAVSGILFYILVILPFREHQDIAKAFDYALQIFAPTVVMIAFLSGLVSISVLRRLIRTQSTALPSFADMVAIFFSFVMLAAALSLGPTWWIFETFFRE
jgi:hypothetical protein